MPEPQNDHILGLPMELLEDIASLCDPVADTLALRLTCRTLAAAALRAFANEYIAHLRCSMLVYSNVKRTHNLITRPYLLGKVQVLYLTLREDFAAHEAHDRCCGKSSDQCPCGSRPVSPDSWTLIETIVSFIGKRLSVMIALDFAWGHCSPVTIQPAPQTSTLLRETVRLARSASNPLAGLYISDRLEINYTDLFPLGNADPPLQQLEVFACILNINGEYNHVELAKIKQHREIVEAVNNHAYRLEHFHIAVDVHWGALNKPFVALSGELLSGPKFSVLQSVRLEDLPARKKIFLDFFDRCPGTLKHISIQAIRLYDEWDAWTGVFQALTRFRTLQTISVNQIFLHCHNDARYVKFIVPEISFDERRLSMYEVVKVDPTRFLDINIEKGLAYSRVRQPEPLSAVSSPMM